MSHYEHLKFQFHGGIQLGQGQKIHKWAPVDCYIVYWMTHKESLGNKHSLDQVC